MLLKDYLKDYLKKYKQNIAILYFAKNGELQCEEFNYHNLKDIDKFMLEYEIMEINAEDDCVEIWVKGE